VVRGTRSCHVEVDQQHHILSEFRNNPQASAYFCLFCLLRNKCLKHKCDLCTACIRESLSYRCSLKQTQYLQELKLRKHSMIPYSANPQRRATTRVSLSRFEEYRHPYRCTRRFKYDRDKLWLVYIQSVPVIFEPPCTLSLSLQGGNSKVRPCNNALNPPKPGDSWNCLSGQCRQRSARQTIHYMEHLKRCGYFTYHQV
jgi:hypothetical protein